MDHPNHRSLHTKSVHRVGGVGLMLGVLGAWVLLPAVLPLSVWAGVCLLVLISFADDIFALPVWLRLLVHCVAAVFLSTVLLFDTHGWLIAVIAAISIIWMTNLYN
ncbi:MAG: glycosyl transferase, partial [Nitrosomonadaceae bacterium]